LTTEEGANVRKMPLKEHSRESGGSPDGLGEL